MCKLLKYTVIFNDCAKAPSLPPPYYWPNRPFPLPAIPSHFSLPSNQLPKT